MNALFAETLRKLRTEKGISQNQLGKQLFVNHSTVARWENGSRLPDASMIPRLADSLGVDANKEATGYSFPSGHTAAAGPMLGGTAMCFKEKKAVPPICIIILLMVSVFGVLIGGMLGRCALVLVIILVWPVVIRMICGQEECRTQKDRLHNGDNTK